MQFSLKKRSLRVTFFEEIGIEPTKIGLISSTTCLCVNWIDFNGCLVSYFIIWKNFIFNFLTKFIISNCQRNFTICIECRKCIMIIRTVVFCKMQGRKLFVDSSKRERESFFFSDLFPFSFLLTRRREIRELARRPKSCLKISLTYFWKLNQILIHIYE